MFWFGFFQQTAFGLTWEAFCQCTAVCVNVDALLHWYLKKQHRDANKHLKVLSLFSYAHHIFHLDCFLARRWQAHQIFRWQISDVVPLLIYSLNPVLSWFVLSSSVPLIPIFFFFLALLSPSSCPRKHSMSLQYDSNEASTTQYSFK